jgi:hypothetical protein
LKLFPVSIYKSNPVVNRVHYFGTDQFAGEPGLSDADMLALIEFLKTL